VVASGEGLQWDQSGVVLKQDRDARGSIDLRLAGPARDALPAEAGEIKPIGKWTPPRLEHAVR
jgi:hypothetical protein